MPKNNDPRIPLSKETRKRLTIYKTTNDFKSYEEAIINLLEEIEKKKVKS